MQSTVIAEFVLNTLCCVRGVAVQGGCLAHTGGRLLDPTLMQVLPKVCPGGRATELLAAHGQRGGSKQKIGAPQAAEGVHPDKHALHVSLQAAESTERPGRLGTQQGHVSCFHRHKLLMRSIL